MLFPSDKWLFVIQLMIIVISVENRGYLSFWTFFVPTETELWHKPSSEKWEQLHPYSEQTWTQRHDSPHNHTHKHANMNLQSSNFYQPVLQRIKDMVSKKNSELKRTKSETWHWCVIPQPLNKDALCLCWGLSNNISFLYCNVLIRRAWIKVFKPQQNRSWRTPLLLP